MIEEIISDPPVISYNHKFLAQFHSGASKIMDTMRLMSLCSIIARTPIGIHLNGCISCE